MVVSVCGVYVACSVTCLGDQLELAGNKHSDYGRSLQLARLPTV